MWHKSQTLRQPLWLKDIDCTAKILLTTMYSNTTFARTMIQLEETHIRELIYHPFKMDGEETNLNDSIYTYQDPGELETLKKIFLKPFLTNVNTFEFTHAIDVKLNVLFELASSIHKDGDFISTSKQIARHLQSVSKHPNIKEGDLFIMKFDHIGLHDESYQGLGIYKIENKENFIETNSLSTENAGLQFKKGIGTKRLDKACLIVFTEEPYTLFVIDNAPIETDYWQNEFIKLSMKNDYVNHTNQFLTLAKTFVTDQIPKDFEVSKADQIDYLNRSVDYFKTHDNFDKAEFEEAVFQDEGLITSFRRFDSAYKQENRIDIDDDFTISAQAVKKQARIFKSVLKLDKNFHIYIHGDRDLIEQGQDSDGRKYYKIYFEHES